METSSTYKIKHSFAVARDFVLRPYYMLRLAKPVWFWLNSKGRAGYFENPIKLDSLQERLVNELKKNGIVVTHLDELFPGENMTQLLQQAAAEAENGAQVSRKKKFLTELWDTIPTLDLSNPFVQLTLRPNVVNIVNSYFEMWAKFTYYTLNITMPVPPGTPHIQSQRWHRDPGDKKFFKIFIYLTDVDEESGPFNYVLGSNYNNKWRNVFRQRPPHGYYPPEGALDKVVPKSDIKMCVGRAGTVVFADTSGLHYGGYATKSQRMMYTGGFASAACKFELRFKYPENFAAKRKELTPVLQYALTH